MLTEPLAPYMLWAKTRKPAEIDLAGSNLLPCTLEDLPGAAEALQLAANNDNGFAPLVEAIAIHKQVTTDRIMTGGGCSGVNFLAIAALVGAGDEVLVEQPGYDPLVGACELMGAKVRRFARPFDRAFRIDLDALQAAITPTTRLIIVSSPHNPSGVSLDAETLRRLAAIAESAHAHLLVDEVYLDAVNLAAGDDALNPSAAQLEGPVIVTASLTKSFGLAGLRCGWAVAPAALVTRMHRVRDLVDVIGSVPAERLSAFAFSQMPALKARTRSLLTANLDLARKFIAGHSQLSVAEKPRANVTFPRLAGVADTSDFVDSVAKTHDVAVAAGRYFDAPEHIRISLAGRTDRLAEGLDRLSLALNSYLRFLPMRLPTVRTFALATLVLCSAFVARAGLQARDRGLENQAALRSAQTAPTISRDQLLADLKTLSADDMEGRLVGSPGGAKARAFVVARFKAVGLKPFGESFESPFTFMGGRGAAAAERQGVNIVGYVTGTKEPNRYIVVSAHYDHIGVRNGVTFNGSDDNASGTAGLFALAEYFVKNPPAHSIIFAAFDAEESGLRGARAFVAKPPVDASALIIDLNMDMIGRDPKDLLFVVGTYTQPALKPVIEQVAASAPVKLTIGHDDPTKKDVEDWTTDSDHAAFCQAKIPCLYFGVEDFENHHKATDKYDTMSHDFYVRAVETMVQVTRAFDAAPPTR